MSETVRGKIKYVLLYPDEIFQYQKVATILKEQEEEINAVFGGNDPSPRQALQAYDGLPRQFVFDEEAEWSD